MCENGYDTCSPPPGIAHVTCNGHDKMKCEPTMLSVTGLWEEAGKLHSTGGSWKDASEGCVQCGELSGTAGSWAGLGAS